MRVLLAAVAATLVVAAPAAADDASLYRGPAPRPGPDILYSAPAAAPQLTNAAPFAAPPILVSGATAYRDGEFLYQDFLYDDHGARAATRDPGDPRTSADTFSNPNGAYTYPTAHDYAGNAADLVELRVKPTASATLFRLTLNTMIDPQLVAATIAIGNSATPRPFPFGANATAPAQLFLTVHGTTGDLRDALTGVTKPAPPVTVETARRQITVSVPHSSWNPGTSTVRLAAGVGLWDRTAGKYLIPQSSATATTPGGAAGLPAPTAFFNVAFRTAEPLPDVHDPSAVVNDPAWWRDSAQGSALRTGDLSSFHADVDFAKLAAGTDDESGVPRTGVLDRILASHYEPSQGIDFSKQCGQSSGCEGELRGRLQPYALYVPKAGPAGGRYALTLLLHSLGANYNQFSGTRNQSQFGERGGGNLVLTASGRGPDGWYYDHAGADTFEAWADVARHYALDPDRTSIAGYSMGGYATYKFATEFPDLFARAQPTVGPPGLGIWTPPGPPQPGGDQSLTYRQLASVRNVPFLIWDAVQDELVPYPGPVQQAQGFDDLGYRYEFDSFAPAEHLTLAVHDQYAPAAAFLGNARVDRDPAHVTYVRNPTMDFPADGTTADHAYWLSGIALRDGSGTAPLGSADARSSGFGTGDPTPSATTHGAGTLSGGTLGSIPYTSQARTWGSAPKTAKADALALKVRNLRELTVHPDRARITCGAAITLDTDGPVTVHLDGCSRTVTATGAGKTTSATRCATGSGVRSVTTTPRGHGVRIAIRRGAAGGARIDVLRDSAGGRVATKTVRRFRGVRRAVTWRARGARDGLYTVRVKLAGDTRTVELARRHGRFRRVAAAQRHPTCGAIRTFALGRPAFGGRTHRRLAVHVRLAPGRHGRIELRRRGRTLRHVSVGGSRTWRIRPGALRRGAYAIRVVTGAHRATLHARRI
jgi:predicted esterase